MPDRSTDWLTQALRNLDQAADSAAADRHEWACFAAEQAAEIAAKALHLKLGQRACGYIVRRLLEELPESMTVPPDLLDKARTLDLYDIPTPYPNGHEVGPPGEHYGQLQSDKAIDLTAEG